MNPGSVSHNNASATNGSSLPSCPGTSGFQPPREATQPSASGGRQAMDVYLKVLSPANRKEYRMYTLRDLRMEDIDCSSKFTHEIFSQCGDSVVPKPSEMEVGYFHQSKKFWLNNRLDMNDAREILNRGDNLIFWCVGINTPQTVASESRKRAPDQQDSGSDEECEPRKHKKAKKKLSKQDERKAMAEEYETTLKEKHQDTYTRFQYKLWAEMLAAGVHTDINTPPAASMFSQQNRRKNASNDTSGWGDAVAGMVNILSQTLSPSTHKADRSGQAASSSLSTMKCAELR